MQGMTTAATSKDMTGLLIAGYTMAFVLPIGGVIAGIAVANRRLGHGMAIACLSTLVGLGWVLLVLALVSAG